MVGPIIVGIIASAVSGYLAIAGLLRLVRTHSYDGFVIYRVIAGAVVPAADRHRGQGRDLLGPAGGD